MHLILFMVQELGHLHAAAVLMTVVMIVAFLSSIAIVRRILMATSVLKASTISGQEKCFHVLSCVFKLFCKISCIIVVLHIMLYRLLQKSLGRSMH